MKNILRIIETNNALRKNYAAIHHHLGVGDHILCNGLVRTLYNQGCVYKTLFVFCKEKSYNVLSRMYTDEPNICLIPIPHDHANLEIYWVNEFVYKHNIMNFMRSGFGSIDTLISLGLCKTFDECFYTCLGIPYLYRWTKFKLVRNENEEARILNKLNPNKEKYIFVHDDPSRGFNITPQNSSGYKIIRNDVSENLFDMIGILENAEEIHCMESSMRCLIEHLNVTDKLFLYTNVRSDGHGKTLTSGSNKIWYPI